MDPIVIGTALGSVVVTPLAKQLLDRATSPEAVAKAINWVLSAADRFLKVKRGQTKPDDPIPPLPIPETENEAAQVLPSLQIKREVDAFTLELLASQVDSLMKQIEIYLANLQHVSQQAAQYGGEEFAPIPLVNQIKLQRKSIIERLNELAGLMNQIYGVQVKEVDKLANAFEVT
jgi:hypothetical protein